MYSVVSPKICASYPSGRSYCASAASSSSAAATELEPETLRTSRSTTGSPFTRANVSTWARPSRTVATSATRSPRTGSTRIRSMSLMLSGVERPVRSTRELSSVTLPAGTSRALAWMAFTTCVGVSP